MGGCKIPLGTLGDHDVQGPRIHPTSGVREVGYLYTHSHQSWAGLLPRVLISHTFGLLGGWMMRILVSGEKPRAKMPAGLGWKSAHVPSRSRGWDARVTGSIWQSFHELSAHCVQTSGPENTDVCAWAPASTIAPLFPSQVAALSLTHSSAQSAAVCPPLPPCTLPHSPCCPACPVPPAPTSSKDLWGRRGPWALPCPLRAQMKWGITPRSLRWVFGSWALSLQCWPAVGASVDKPLWGHPQLSAP